jgi:hypothetical protein
MGGVAVDVGLITHLNARFNNSWPTSKDLTAKLFCNYLVPTDATVAGDFTEATGGGYAPITLTCGNWTVSNVSNIVQALYPQITWTFTGVLTTNPVIFGFYIIDGNGILQWAENLPTPVQPAINGNYLKVTPIYRISKGTPT